MMDAIYRSQQQKIKSFTYTGEKFTSLYVFSFAFIVKFGIAVSGVKMCCRDPSWEWSVDLQKTTVVGGNKLKYQELSFQVVYG